MVGWDIDTVKFLLTRIALLQHNDEIYIQMKQDYMLASEITIEWGKKNI